MSIRAVMKLGQRMARRNYLYLFAWLCATVLPVGMQLLAGSVEEIRDYLDFYYGTLTLFMLFSLTFSFGTVFVSYYLASGYRRAGTLDLMRVSGVRPLDVVSGIYLAIERILIPPLLTFVAGYLLYIWLDSLYHFSGAAADAQAMISGIRWGQIASFGFGLLFNQMFLAALPCLVICRREGAVALAGMVLVMPLNSLQVVFYMILHWPAWSHAAIMLTALALLLLISWWNLARLWPPQVMPHR